MHQRPFFVPVCCLITFGLLALNPSPVLASDYSRMVVDALFLIAVLGGLALVLGVATSAVLVRIARRKWLWYLIPVFAVAWCALLLGAIKLWAAYEYSAAGPEIPPAPPPVLVPEG